MEKETKKRKPKKIEDSEQTAIITKVTSKEYEKLYRLYLKNNNFKNSLLNRKTFENYNKGKIIIEG